MTETGFLHLKSGIIQLLSNGLDARLTYHNLDHTLDVLSQAERIASAENFTDTRQLMLLRIAALFHDTGFLYTYKEHEKRSCEIMRCHLENGLCSTGEIKSICKMIMATKIPQLPEDLSGEILCDADLDYLGRDDFESISNSLKKEFKAYKVISSDKEWDPLQIRFFGNHSYYTKTSLENRNPKKMLHLDIIKKRNLKENA